MISALWEAPAYVNTYFLPNGSSMGGRRESTNYVEDDSAYLDLNAV